MDNINPYEKYIRPYLKSSETIMWANKPVKNLIYLPADLFSIILGAFWIAFSLFWVAFTITPALKQGAEAVTIIMPFLSIPFFIFGLWNVILKNLFRLKVRKQAIYAITNKRILTIHFEKGYAEQYLFSEIARIEVKADKKGIGSIFFFSSTDGKKRLSTSGIFGVENIQEVAKIVEERMRKKG